MNNMGGLQMLKMMPGFNKVRSGDVCSWHVTGWAHVAGGRSWATGGQLAVGSSRRPRTSMHARTRPHTPCAPARTFVQISEKQLYEAEKKFEMYETIINAMDEEVRQVLAAGFIGGAAGG